MNSNKINNNYLVNLHANTNNLLRLRTQIFPGEEHIIFVPKNG